jgi:hypothetical protein
MVQDFLAKARAFIDWVDAGPEFDMTALHAHLAALQCAAASLPDSGPDDADGLDLLGPSYEDVLRRLDGLPIDRYQAVFNALNLAENEPVMCSLKDDLADIYQDLFDGLGYHNQGRAAEAAWVWRSGYYSHWGRHAIHAQAAVWQYLADG